MIYNLDEYEPYIRDILQRIPLCYSAQLERCLVNTYEEVDEYFAHEILLSIQRRGYVYLSSDGWAMTKGMYIRITGDRCNYNVSVKEDSTRLGPMTSQIKKAGVAGNEIDCFWLAIDLIPDSKEFVLGTTPWYILFDTSASNKSESRLYQITKIEKEKELARCELLKNLPKVENEKMQSVISRLAIIENESHAWMVPHIGFTHICVLDPNSPRHYRIVEKRTGKDIWG